LLNVKYLANKLGVVIESYGFSGEITTGCNSSITGTAALVYSKYLG
jgi:hypothetical protein